MVHKNKEYARAIKLRKEGFSYREILKEISVAKSTLSLWLRDVGLSQQQTQRLTQKRYQASLRGAQARRNQRLTTRDAIIINAEKDIPKLSKRDMFLLGVVLYWCEGTKEKLYRESTSLSFINSDPQMIKCYLYWIKNILSVEKEKIDFEIYVHENSRNNSAQVIEYWSSCTGFPKKSFQKLYYKKNAGKTKRHNTGNEYYGLLRVRVSASSHLVRKTEGWTRGIVKNWVGA